MATVTAALTLTSSDLLTSSLSVSTSTSATATATSGLSRRPITSTAVGTVSGQVTLYTADDFAAISYVYVKNTDTTTTDYIYIFDDTTSGDPQILKLAGGDWAFLPTVADKTLKAYASTSGTVIEWMVFGTDQ